MDYAEEEINFVDVAKRVSNIQIPVHPAYMLNGIGVPFVRKGGDVLQYVNPIVTAIIEDDFEAYMQMLNAVSSLTINAVKGVLLGSLLLYDRPAMLDEYIRRTGEGIHIDDVSQASHADFSAGDSREEYLGLNVHGKKRKDLARQSDPNAPRGHNGGTVPIVWTAVRNNLTATVRYLAGDQPLAAYRFYAAAHGDQQAKLIRQVPDLAASLPTLLGWTANGVNETALTAAIINNRMQMTEMLFSLRPSDMRTYLHLR